MEGQPASGSSQTVSSSSTASSAPLAASSVNGVSATQEQASATLKVPNQAINGSNATPIATPAPQTSDQTPAQPQAPAKLPAPSAQPAKSPTPTPAERPVDPPRSQPSPIFAKSSAPLNAPTQRPAERSPRPPPPALSHVSSSSSAHGMSAPQYGGPLSTLPHFGVPITSAPQFSGPPVTSSSYNNGPITTAPQFGAPSTSAAQRVNPMAMSSLLSHESAAPASTGAPPVSQSGVSPRMTNAPAQPIVTASPYASMAPERHEGWSFAKPQPRQVDSGFAPKQPSIAPDTTNRQKFQAFERRRQSSEGHQQEGRERYGDVLMRDMEAQHRRKMSFDYGREREQMHRPPAMAAGASLYQPYPPQQHRQETFYQGQRPPEPPQHHHHHHHSSSSHAPRRASELSSLPASNASAQNAWNKAFASPQPWPTSAMPPRPSEEKPLPSAGPSSGHRKRKVGDWTESFEGQGSVIPQHREAPATHEPTHAATAVAPQPAPQPKVVSPPVEKRQPGPLFTNADIDRISSKPKFMQVGSSKVKEAVEAVKEPLELGSFTWDPEVDTSILLDAQTLQKHVGHRLKVAVDGRWLKGAGKVVISDPSAAVEAVDTKPDVPAPILPSSRKVAKDWTVWDLEPIHRRRVWGTDIYSDDSDVLAMCLHSGWVRFSSSLPSTADSAVIDQDVPKALEVTLRIVPQLVRYQSSIRNGLKSRSWGNSHDGVSLQVESVVTVEKHCIKPIRQLEREQKKRKRTAGSRLLELDVHGSQHRLVRLGNRGEAHTPYSAELAARLARALLTAPVHSAAKKGEDVDMKDANDEELDAADDKGDFRLSMLGFTVLLCEGAKRHELVASTDGTYSIDGMNGIAADNLEFSDDSVIARADDFSERAKFSVDRLSWRAPIAA